MSTQHPDNVTVPFFAENSLLGGEDEIQEAFYAYSHLGCDEQMWDFEGKEVDNFVVKKLLTKNENFFKEKKLGKDVFLTFRVPNPAVDRAEGKILLETLESIPRSFDAARMFYGEDITPVFEVILPMTTDAASLDRIYRYYADVVAGKQIRSVRGNDISIGEWVGEFKPDRINVIPLFEDMDHLIHADEIVEEYLKDKDLPYQRVFLARSDPAANYGSIAAVLLLKLSLARLSRLSQRINTPLAPILGLGSAPFRGNFRPETVSQILGGYPSVQTFTIQSSFKFDHPPDTVRIAIQKIQEKTIGEPLPVNEARILPIIKKYAAEYARQVRTLAPAINSIAPYIPKRRKRKLHVGLFGYARNIDDMKLPRAITLTASLYSLGIPPELLGLNALTKDDLASIKEVYHNIEYDLSTPLRFLNPDSPFVPEEIKKHVHAFSHGELPDSAHKECTDRIRDALTRNDTERLKEGILQAAHARGFLG